MKLQVVLEHAHDARAYASTETVVGQVVVQVARRIEFSRLELCIQARVKISEPVETGAEYSLQPYFKKCLKTSRVLFPSISLWPLARCTLEKGRHEFPFFVDLSLLQRYVCIDQGKKPVTSVFYTISATLKHEGFLRRSVTGDATITATLVESPTVPSVPLLEQQCLQTRRLLDLDKHSNRHKGEQPNLGPQDRFLPQYSPALGITASVGNDGLLCIGDPLPLNIWVTVPAVARQTSSMWLQSISVSLLHITTHGPDKYQMDVYNCLTKRFDIDLVIIPGLIEKRIPIMSPVLDSITIPRLPKIFEPLGVSLSSRRSKARNEGKGKSEEDLIHISCTFQASTWPSCKVVSLTIPVGFTVSALPPPYKDSRQS